MLVLPGAARRRLGITVSARLGCAAVRNRIKRLAREVFRRNRELFPAHCELVMVAKSGAADLGYAEVRDEVRQAQSAWTREAGPGRAAKVEK